MFKKVALYGLAFGSVSAAMLFIQYANGLYRERNFLSALPLIANIVLPGIGVFLFIRSISQMKTAKPINMGKALFGALLVCILVALCNVAVYQHIMLNRADIREARLKLEYARIEKYYNSDSTLNESKKTESINTAKENFVKNTSVTTFGRSQFSMCLSTGMVVALLTFLRTYRKE